MSVVPSSEMPWQTYRDVRLRALETDPGQFGSSFEREVALGDEVWAERAMNPGTFLWVPDAAEPEASSQQAPRALGLMSALDADPSFKDSTEMAARHGVSMEELAYLVQVWIQPDARGQGIADALLERCIDSARDRGKTLIVLDVVKGNERAAAVYKRHGFTLVGDSHSSACSGEDEYALRLS